MAAALWACNSVGRVSALQAEGQGFESPLVHYFYNKEKNYGLC